MALTIRPTAEQEKIIEKVKKELGVSTSSAALLKAAELFLFYKDHSDDLGQQLNDSERKRHELRRAVMRKLEADEDLQRIYNDSVR